MGKRCRLILWRFYYLVFCYSEPFHCLVHSQVIYQNDHSLIFSTSFLNYWFCAQRRERSEALCFHTDFCGDVYFQANQLVCAPIKYNLSIPAFNSQGTASSPSQRQQTILHIHDWGQFHVSNWPDIQCLCVFEQEETHSAHSETKHIRRNKSEEWSLNGWPKLCF